MLNDTELQTNAAENLAVEIWRGVNYDGLLEDWVLAVEMARTLKFARFSTKCSRDFIDWDMLGIIAHNNECTDEVMKDRVWVVLAALEAAE